MTPLSTIRRTSASCQTSGLWLTKNDIAIPADLHRRPEHLDICRGVLRRESAGAVLGLHHDYKTLGRKQDRDGFENFLTTLLLDAYGKDSSPLIHITFHEVDGNDVCRVTAKPSPKPVFVRDDKAEHLYIRAGNSTRLLSTREAIEYCKIRWK